MEIIETLPSEFKKFIFLISCSAENGRNIHVNHAFIGRSVHTTEREPRASHSQDVQISGEILFDDADSAAWNEPKRFSKAESAFSKKQV